MAESVLQVVFKGQDQTLTSTTQRIGRNFGRLGGVVKAGALAATTALVGLGAGAVAVGSKLVDLGADANETASLIQTSLGGATDDFNQTLQDFATEANRSFFELQQGSSTIIAMTKAMGASEQGAADFGSTFAMMASDLGSFFNKTDEEVFLDIQSALGGSSETLQKYGVDIRETTLKQLALNQGMIESASEVLPPLMRAQLIQQAITEQASDAMGDAIRTSDSWQNSMKGLRARFRDTATQLGQKLIPVLTPLLRIVGILAEQAVPFLTSAFDRFLPFLQGVVSGFQEAFLALQEGDGLLGAVTSMVWELGYAFGWNEEKLILVRDKIKEVWARIIEIKNTIIEFMTPIMEWIQNNIQLKDVLIALGIVLGGVVLSAIISVVTAIGPLLLIGAALVGLVALVRTAWEENWGGIQEKTAAFMGWVIPKFEQLKAWLQVNIPIAIDWLKNAWETVLLPAIERVWNWMSTVLIPFFRDQVFPWLQEHIPAAIETLRSFWVETLLPGIEKVWDFLTVQMLPVWVELADFFNVAMTTALTALQGVWENILLPSLKLFGNYISESLGPVLEWLKSSVIEPLTTSFTNMSNVIQIVVDAIKRMKDQLINLELPDWMTPGSPTPWEVGLTGVRKQLQSLSIRELPTLQASLNGFSQGNNVQNVVNNQQSFTWNVNPASFDGGLATRQAIQFAVGGP